MYVWIKFFCISCMTCQLLAEFSLKYNVSSIYYVQCFFTVSLEYVIGFQKENEIEQNTRRLDTLSESIKDQVNLLEDEKNNLQHLEHEVCLLGIKFWMFFQLFENVTIRDPHTYCQL